MACSSRLAGDHGMHRKVRREGADHIASPDKMDTIHIADGMRKARGAEHPDRAERQYGQPPPLDEASHTWATRSATSSQVFTPAARAVAAPTTQRARASPSAPCPMDDWRALRSRLSGRSIPSSAGWAPPGRWLPQLRPRRSTPPLALDRQTRPHQRLGSRAAPPVPLPRSFWHRRCTTRLTPP